MSSSDVLTYAQEVYAACATVGYTSESVARLKAVLDKVAGQPSEFQTILLKALAQQVQLEAVSWTDVPQHG